jgi:hypothetical protein
MPITLVNDVISAYPQFGVGANAVRVRRIALDSARNKERMDITGTFIYAIRASSKTVELDIAFQDQHQDVIPFYEGQFIAGISYAQVYLTNTAVSGGYVDIMYGVEAPQGLRVQNPSSQYNNISFVKGATLTTPADYTTVGGAGAAVLMVAANASRRRLIVQAKSTNTNTARVGGSTVTGSVGPIIGAGQSIEFTTTAAIYIWDAAVAGDKYQFLEESD